MGCRVQGWLLYSPGVTVLLARCDAALVGAGVVTWQMWGTAWCLGCVSGVSGAGVCVVLTGGQRIVTWWALGPTV